MRRIQFNFAACALATLAGAVSPVIAEAQARSSMEPNVSVYSDISRKRCGGRMATSDHEVVTDRCGLIAGFRSETTYRGTSVAFRLVGSGPGQAVLGAGYGVGDAIEWRGARANGRFAPRAAIVRLQSRDPAGRVVSTLAILRVEGGTACQAGFLDGNEASANARARETADRIGRSFRCGQDRAEIIGTASEAVREIVDRSR